MDSLHKQGKAATQALLFKPINPDINKTLLANGLPQSTLDKMEDNGKEEFLTTLVQKYPQLNEHLQTVLDQTLSSVLGGAGITRQKYAGGGKISRKVAFEAGVGPAPFAKTTASKLGQSIYDLEKSSGLSRGEFDDIVQFAKTNDLSEAEFRTYLAKRIAEKKAKSQLMMNPESLRRFLSHGTQTAPSTPKQLSLAKSLMGEPDSQYRPKYASGGEIPIMAQEGEFVINKRSAQAIGYKNLSKLNKYHSGGKVQKLAGGDVIAAHAAGNAPNPDPLSGMFSKMPRVFSVLDQTVGVVASHLMGFSGATGKTAKNLERLDTYLKGQNLPSNQLIRALTANANANNRSAMAQGEILAYIGESVNDMRKNGAKNKAIAGWLAKYTQTLIDDTNTKSQSSSLTKIGRAHV